jgi:hypothetical protein
MVRSLPRKFAHTTPLLVPYPSYPLQKAVKKADGTKRFSVAEINAISIPAYALMLLAMLLFAYVHAKTGWHTVWVLVQEVSARRRCRRR